MYANLYRKYDFTSCGPIAVSLHGYNKKRYLGQKTSTHYNVFSIKTYSTTLAFEKLRNLISLKFRPENKINNKIRSGQNREHEVYQL